MYEEKSEIKQQTPEHIEKAQMFANFIINEFNPIQQNEAIRHAMSILRQQRNERIAIAKGEIELLSKSLEELNQF